MNTINNYVNNVATRNYFTSENKYTTEFNSFMKFNYLSCLHNNCLMYYISMLTNKKQLNVAMYMQ